MGFHHTDDDIVAVSLSGSGLLQHFIGFADAWRGTHENFELAETPVFASGRLEQGLRRGALVLLAPLICHKASVFARDSRPRDHCAPALSRARFSSRTLTRGSPNRPRVRPSVCAATRSRSAFSGMLRAFATRGTWKSAA